MDLVSTCTSLYAVRYLTYRTYLLRNLEGRLTTSYYETRAWREGAPPPLLTGAIRISQRKERPRFGTQFHFHQLLFPFSSPPPPSSPILPNLQHIDAIERGNHCPSNSAEPCPIAIASQRNSNGISDYLSRPQYPLWYARCGPQCHFDLAIGFRLKICRPISCVLYCFNK